MLLVLFLLSWKCCVIPLGVSQLYDLEIPERWRHFHIQLPLLFLITFWGQILVSQMSRFSSACVRRQYTVKSHFKALGLYNFKRGFGWAYKWRGLYPGGLISGIKKKISKRRDKTYLRNELKLTVHYILS